MPQGVEPVKGHAYNLANPTYAAQILGKETSIDIEIETPCPKRLSEPPVTKPLQPYQTLKEHKRLNEPLLHVSSPISKMIHIYIYIYACVYIFLYIYLFQIKNK